MKRWKYSLIGCLALLVLSGIYLFLNLTPTRHFEEGRVPVLATPVPDGGIAELESDTQLQSFNVLILGTDARKLETSRTDLIMLAHMEFTSKKITLVSIPRDTRVEIPQVGFTKINHAHMIGEIGGGNHSGTEAVLEIVSDFLQCDINYYIKVNFQGFKDIVDTIGGVDIELPAPVKLTFSYVVLDSGNQHIDGDLALKLMKERFSLPDGDFGRQKNHLLLIQSIVSKLLKPRYAKELPLLIQQVKENIIDTNLTVDDILSLAWAFQGMSQENIVHIQIPGHSYYAQDPLVQARVYYWIPDEEKVEEISQKF